MSEQPHYSPRVAEALTFTAHAFRHQARKGTGIPYLTHLLQVATWVMEYGGDEDQFIAALLHDYLEDIEGSSTDELETRFGADVASMVLDLSDSTTRPKPPWRERKEAYLARLRTKPERVKLISASDKLHNATTIIRDLGTHGEAIWDRFKAGRDGSLWYYEQVVVALGHEWQHPLLSRLRHTVRELWRAADAGEPQL